MSPLLSWVNPLQGTDSDSSFSTGNTLPLVARPFGMHHWTLQTGTSPWLFHPRHRLLRGIRLTHQPSPWMGDYSSLLVIPFHGPIQNPIEHQASSYRLLACSPHELEINLLRYQIHCQMTPSERGALFVFTSRSNEPLQIRFHFDGAHSLNSLAGQNTFHGHTANCSWGMAQPYPLHFYGQFSDAAIQFTPLPDGGYWTFPANVRRLELRLSGSFLDSDTACTTLHRELGALSFDALRNETAQVWEKLLQRLAIITDDARQSRTYYSCLYRCLLFPRQLSEPNAEGKIVHRSPYDLQIHSGPLCADNGFWDTHRTVYPLLALAYSDHLKVILEGWLNACRQAGWSPKWASPGLRDCMIGTHFDAVVADAVARGITDWNVEEAFTYLWKNATVPSDNGCYGRRELEGYLRLGYVPSDKGYHAPVSTTLDYAYNDFCVAQVARFLGREKEAHLLEPRTRFYRNVFDPSLGFMRARLSDGSWQEPFRQFSWGGGFVEGGTWQHTFNVPHDPKGLAALFGGATNLCNKLDMMLSLPPIFETGTYGQEIHEMTEMAFANFGQYAQSNQPVHGFLFLYSLLGQPHKTAHWVRRVATELYSPDTFPGDEDNGEMAAWYVWATIGRYPQCPGKPGYVEFSPLAQPTATSVLANR